MVQCTLRRVKRTNRLSPVIPVKCSCKDKVFVRGQLGETVRVVLVVDETSGLVDDVDGKDHFQSKKSSFRSWCPVAVLLFLVDWPLKVR